MVIYDKQFKNTDDMQRFIDENEHIYRSQTEAIASIIAEDENITIITLSGPSCAGKTTSSYILERVLEENYGIDSKIISIDNFFKNRAEIIIQEKPDYESIESIDFELFKSCVEDILSGKKTYLPYFDFETGIRDDEHELYTPHRHGVVIFEGIQAMYPEITAILPPERTVSIYIDILDDVYAYGQIFTKRDIRFFRRLVRDYKFRGASVSKTLSLWNDVVANEKKNIFPYSFGAKYSINSMLLYDINVIKSYLLNELDFGEENAKLYNKIKKIFEDVPDIPSELVPRDSVFREFIGI